MEANKAWHRPNRDLHRHKHCLIAVGLISKHKTNITDYFSAYSVRNSFALGEDLRVVIAVLKGLSKRVFFCFESLPWKPVACRNDLELAVPCLREAVHGIMVSCQDSDLKRLY